MLTHKGTVILQTERLTLRRFTIADAEAMYNNWANDERVTRFLTWLPHESPEATKQLLELWCADYVNPNVYQWAMEYEGKAIGSISVVRIEEQEGFMELGYCIGHGFWNKGFMTEAVQAVIDFLFTEVHASCVGISHAVKNPGSGKVAQKCGLTLTETKKEAFQATNGELLDMSYYDMTRSKWEEQKDDE